MEGLVRRTCVLRAPSRGVWGHAPPQWDHPGLLSHHWEVWDIKYIHAFSGFSCVGKCNVIIFVTQALCFSSTQAMLPLVMQCVGSTTKIRTDCVYQGHSQDLYKGVIIC